MGAYLSSPVTEKISIDNNLEFISYGASSMQGWRISQEDAHNCCPHYDKENKSSLFAVYDGHGGAEVAEYCALNLPDFIKNDKNYKGGNYAQALEDAFLEFDATLTTPPVISELKTLAGTHEDEDEEDEQEAAMLAEEADMPLDELMERYGGGELPPPVGNLNKKESFLSPLIRGKKSKPVLGVSANSAHNSIDAVSEKDGDMKNLANKLFNGHSDNETNGNITKEVAPKVEGDANNIKEVADSTQDGIEEERTLKKSTEDDKDNVDSGVSSSVDITEEKVCSEKPAPSGSVSSGTDIAESSSSGATSEAGSSSAVGSSSGAGSSCVVESSSAGGSSSSACGSSSADQAGSSAGGSTVVDEVEDDDDDPDDATFVEGQEVEEDSSDCDDDDDAEEGDEDDDDDEDEEDGEAEGVGFGGDTEEPGSDSGCTAVVGLLTGRDLYVANAGDSRCVLCRGGKAIDMSVDHKPEDDIEQTRIKKAGGKVTPDGRVNGGLNLSRAIGDHCYKKNKELPLKEQMISALPDVKSITLQEDDEFMVLACDGIWNYMTSQEVVDFISERLKKENMKSKLSVICEELFDHCLAPNTMGDGTGCDNMTCVIVAINKLPEAQGSKRKVEETEETEESSKRARLDDETGADGDK